MATITGGAGNDSLVGTGDPDVISGLGGNDSIISARGADTLFGGAGDTGGIDSDTASLHQNSAKGWSAALNDLTTILPEIRIGAELGNVRSAYGDPVRVCLQNEAAARFLLRAEGCPTALCA